MDQTLKKRKKGDQRNTYSDDILGKGRGRGKGGLNIGWTHLEGTGT